MLRLATTAVLLAAISSAPGAMAAELGAGVRLNGFLSQGYLKSDENNYLVQDSTDGSAQINEAGLAINWNATDSLRLGAQVLSSDLGQDGNNQLTLDWAFADYRVLDSFGVRAGKIKLPVGLYNETRDSDFLRSMAFLPQSVYDEMQRSFMVAGNGIGVYGNLFAGPVGDIDYQVFYGKMDVDVDRLLVDNGIRAGLDQIIAGVGGALGAPTGVTGIDYDADYTIAASVVVNTTVDGLRFGLSYLRTQGRFNPAVSDPAGAFAGIVDDFSVSANYDHMYVASVEYTRSMVTVQSEYMRRKEDVIAHGLAPLSPFIGNAYELLNKTVEGYYVMANIRIPQVSGLSVSTMYDQFYADADNHDGAERRDLGFGIRYDFNQRFLVKAEWHDIKGTAMNLSMLNSGSLVQDWSYYALKLSYNF